MGVNRNPEIDISSMFYYYPKEGVYEDDEEEHLILITTSYDSLINIYDENIKNFKDFYDEYLKKYYSQISKNKMNAMIKKLITAERNEP